MNPKTAILFFARTPAAEAAQKPLFLKSNSNNRHLFSGLNCHALSVAAGTGMPVFNFDESRQKGKDFGQKLTNAFQEVFSQGFNKVIAIGNDCPSLTTTLLLNAADALSINSAVLGPDNRGGVYLLGLTKKAFIKGALECLAWQSPQLLNDLVSLLNEKRLLFHTHSSFHDLNNIADLYLTRYTLPKNHAIAVLVQELLYKKLPVSGIIGFQFTEDLYSAVSLRAPPCPAV